SVDGLVVLLVRMWHRHLRANRNREFKHRQGTVRVGGFEQEFNSDLPDADNFGFHGFLELLTEQLLFPAESAAAPGFARPIAETVFEYTIRLLCWPKPSRRNHDG